jgi:phosphatidylethanolamine/phosphatidyl-N-methylethanolamine N-methyltransferase
VGPNNDYYLNNYEKMMKSGITNFIFKLHHKMIESQFTNRHFHNILEIASYDDSHLKYIKCNYDNYILSDINPIVMKNIDNMRNEKIKTLVLSAEDLTQLQTDSFDRVIISCIVSHIKDIEKMLFNIKRIIKNGGFVSIYVPCEPGLILRLAR